MILSDIHIEPANPDLLFTVFTHQILLVCAWLIGLLVRRILRRWVRISLSAATLTALIGLWLGLIVTGLVFEESQAWRPMMVATAALIAAVVVAIVAVVLTWLHHEPPLPPIHEVATYGESERLEFKSSARWNMRTQQRDDVMETVIAKTVVAFMNSGGGTLLIGVDDDGQLIGLDPDYRTLKKPDSDRFELWLRDMWGQRMGTNAASLPLIDFASATHGTGEVCRVTVPPSPFPVFLLGPKGKGSPELWVRVGNSTRRFEVDDAITYVAHRWPTAVRPGIRVRLGTFLLRHRQETRPQNLPKSVRDILPR